MTVSTSTAKSGPYAGSGTTGPFTVTFRFLANSHLRVVRTVVATGVETDLVLTTDYTVTGAGAASGTVTLVTALAVGETLTILRNVPATQEADYVVGDAFPAESHETALDKLTMLVQQNAEEIGRSLRIPASSSASVSAEIPPPDGNYVFGWNAAGTAIRNVPPAELATLVAYGTAKADVFAGDGTETDFDLQESPASLNNLDVSVNGVTFVPGVDYQWTDGTTVTFTTAPPNGSEILIRYMQGLPFGSSDSSDVRYTRGGTGAVPTTVEARLRQMAVSVKDFGAVGDGVTNDTAAIKAAIASLRKNPTQISSTIGGGLITVYTSGTVYFPSGVYLVSPDELRIEFDIGLKLVGDGSRRTNNAQYGSTTILTSAASTGFVIQTYGSGGRGLTIEDMDICYNGAFTGSLIDVDDTPGLTMNRCYVGTYGITGGTRQVTAAACIRSTYDEFMSFNNCVFNGAQLGWWIDNVRVFAGNTFGGSFTKFDSCVFYDFAVNHVYSDGTRTKDTVNFIGCAFNPIQVGPSSSAINVDNIDGLNITGSGFTVSTGFPPASQWLRATNCTGQIVGNNFNDLAPSAYLSGYLDVSGNNFSGTAGPTLVGGVITGKNNEFSKGSGWLLTTPDFALAVDIGPDHFKSPVTRSYDIPADNTLFSGRVNYDKANDASVNKFRNLSERIAFMGKSDRLIEANTTPLTLSILETGNTYVAGGLAPQAFTLPTPIRGTRLCISKVGNQDLSVTCAATTNYYGVGSIYPTAASLTGAAMGTIELEAYGEIGWIVKSLVGAWSFT